MKRRMIRIFLLTEWVTLGFAVQMVSANPSNILFIAIDDLRPVLGSYGVAQAQTPRLDTFAESVVQFNRAYCTYPLCSPSRASMLTGQRSKLYNEEGKKHSTEEMISGHKAWPAVLHDAGYWTVTHGKIYHSNVPDSDKSAWDIPGASRLGPVWRSEPGNRDDENRSLRVSCKNPEITLTYEGDGSVNLSQVFFSLNVRP